MPPKGGLYGYSRSKIHREVPDRPGIYWLWSFGELVRIGQSNNLHRRLLEYSDKSPNRFRYQEVDTYFERRDEVMKPPAYTISGGTVLDKIEHTEFEAYKQKHGCLPPWNKYDKNYDVGVFESIISKFRR